MNADLLVRARAFFANQPADASCLLVLIRVIWVSASIVALMAPEELYEQDLSRGVVLAAVAATVGIVVVVGGHWLTQSSLLPSSRWLGFALPRRWWLWLPVGAAAGFGLSRGLTALHLPQLWPALTDSTAQQLANNEQREAEAFTWTDWTHAAGEEVIFRMPVVAAACFALGFTGARMPDASRARLSILAGVVIATALLFGLIHLDYGWYNVVTTWVLGAGCAAIAIASRSVWPAATLHAAYNTANHFPDIVWSLW
ncbi:CPBP family intramembrane glutamic endopeptidase [Tsukamurella paurometabola]|uniref:Abortive infection protein n=1 Tax=Tsukamurella paurometabola (strain ATCC 8368 / DSM 20162 / CCUG 35730 / CIP 100753 / JCM 10117 / KCTC 9821 / NBRC 16120 / NCIMB 702349 / NCTC 13040) TaxID=521096 RepID=D5UQP6_TSUPD|nr:CPBP family intramembrane glutamic endopeptidase [Tsukamurella paurometabola]ADG76879.1 Abortive infection protein [Tsukamurella paurometabola DSM 20162]SUP42036.1 CAAX amino terminal protease self- immunity [Tsukamurella paurometabola]